MHLLHVFSCASYGIYFHTGAKVSRVLNTICLLRHEWHKAVQLCVYLFCRLGWMFFRHQSRLEHTLPMLHAKWHILFLEIPVNGIWRICLNLPKRLSYSREKISCSGITRTGTIHSTVSLLFLERVKHLFLIFFCYVPFLYDYRRLKAETHLPYNIFH